MKYETDPIDGGTYDFSAQAGTPFTFELGGNGLKPNEDPFWDIWDQAGNYVGTIMGTRTNANCVSNQKSVSVTAPFGSVYTYRATYEPGVSGGVVAAQAHFRIFFNIPAPPPPPPGGGGGGGGGCTTRLPCTL